MTGLARSSFWCQVASASGRVCPGDCMQKSISVVLPPKAADTVPEVKSSQVTVPPKGMSMCVCGSMAPGMTYRSRASMTRSARASSELPICVTTPLSTNTSAA